MKMEPVPTNPGPEEGKPIGTDPVSVEDHQVEPNVEGHDSLEDENEIIRDPIIDMTSDESDAYDYSVEESPTHQIDRFDDFTDEELDKAIEEELSWEQKFKNLIFDGNVENTTGLVVSNLYCYHTNGLKKCACMSVFRRPNGKYDMGDELYQDLELLLQDIPICKSLNYREELKKFDNHFVSIMVTTTKDKFLTGPSEMPRDEFIKKVYRLRNHLGDLSDHGQKHLVLNAQSDTDETEAKGLVQMIWDLMKGCGRVLTDVVTCVKDKLILWVNSLFGFISAKLANAVESVVRYMLGYVVDMFGPLKALKELDERQTFVCLVTFVLIFVIFIDVLGVITYVLTTKLIKSLCVSRNAKMEAHGLQPEALGGIISLFGITLGMTKYEMKTVSDKCRQLTSIMAAGFGGSVLLASLFMCLPTVIQNSLAMKFGSAEAKERVLIDMWLTRAQSLVQLSAIPKILVTDQFYQWVRDSLREANGLRKTIKSPVLTNLFIRNMVALTKLSAMLRNLKDEKSFRSYPFSLHVCGPPGFGKTLISSKLLRDVSDIEETSIYTRPVSDEYWSGFIGQDVIMIDEFLIGKGEPVQKMAKEYLELVSTKSFLPPLASIDNASVGIKGTSCKPKVVLTVNNTPYSSIDGIPDDALNRRRHHVVRIGINPAHKDKVVNNEVKISRFTSEEVANVVWLEFSLLSPTPKGPTVDGLSYGELVVLLRESYQEHNENCEKVREGLHGNIELTKTPEEMLEDVMREINGIPNEPQSIFEAFCTVFTDVKKSFSGFMNAQGSGGADETMDDQSASLELKTKIKQVKKDFLRFRKGDSAEKREKARKYLEKHVGDLKAMNVEQQMTSEVSKLIETVVEELKVESDAYFSADEVTQKDMLTKIDHSNVDATRMHRHPCGGCDKHFAHKHGQLEFHDFLCKSCETKKNKERLYNIKDPLARRMHHWKNYDDLYPCVDFESYPDLSEEYIAQVKKKLRDQAIQKFMDFGSVPLFDIGEDENKSTGELLAMNVSAIAKWTARAIGLWCLIRGVKRIVFGKKEDEGETVCFSSQSSSWPPSREHHKSGGRLRVRNGRMYAQGFSPNVIEIRVLCQDPTGCYAFPISNRTFVTVNHIFETKDGLIPDGTMIRLTYQGSTVEVPFKVDNLMFVEGSDIAFYNTGPTKLNQFPNSTSKFWTESQASRFTVGPILFHTDEGLKMSTCTKMENVKYYNKRLNRKKEICEGLVYFMKMELGDCGVAIASTGSVAGGSLMGIHVCGGESEGRHQGAAAIVTREMIRDALEIQPIETVCGMFAQSGPFGGPNLKSVEIVEDRVFGSKKSKLNASDIVGYLPWEPVKHKPILSSKDPRSGGMDPVVNMINDTLSVEPITFDEKVFGRVVQEQSEWWMKKLRWPIEKRRLSFVEALKGVPGKLSSCKINSSAGFPLCKTTVQKGKKDFFYFDDDGELQYSEYFREMVEEREQEMLNGEAEKDRFLIFAKDELVTEKKIDEKRVRLIYAGNLVSNIVFRQYFGSLLCAFNQAFLYSPSAVGLNPYSWDMDVIFDYLCEVQPGEESPVFVAGDFKNFDKNMIKEFQLAAYQLIMDLMGDTVPVKMKEAFLENQVDPFVQYDRWLIEMKTSHFSGCFFTTVVNNLVHELYLRYVFAIVYPDLRFSENVRCKILGDDHIYSFSRKAQQLNPLKIASVLSSIGQKYTSDVKDAELDDEFRRFEDITFLGAHPIMYEGKYCGALKKSTIEESCCWTRNRNETLAEELKTMIEFASMWGQSYFDDVQIAVQHAWLREYCDHFPYDLLYSETRRSVALRTASNGNDFFSFLEAHGLGEVIMFAQSGKVGLTDLGIEHEVVADQVSSEMNSGFSSRAVGQEVVDMSFGPESDVFRSEFPWSTSDTVGTVLKSWAAPFGILGEGTEANVQNMAFDRFVFWTGNPKLRFQVNGTKFQQGLLAVYWVPLGDYEYELANIVGSQHILLQPDKNSTGTIEAKFLYYRSLMNTLATATESLGTFKAVVLSPLRAADATSVSVAMYSSFPRSKFRIPKPLATTGSKYYYAPVNGRANSKVVRARRHVLEIRHEGEVDETMTEMVAHGAGQSTTVNNTYTNVGGAMPISDVTNTPTAHLDQTQDISPEVSIPMPLDNPPMASGGIPVQQQYTGMSTSFGVRPTVDLQLFPAAFNREQMQIFDPAETKIESILGKPALLRVMDIYTTDPAGKLLRKFQMNTRFGLAEGTGIPLNVAFLNQFMFWRCDIEFTFAAVRTSFHSMRIQALVGYGAEDVEAESRNVSMSHIMNFSNEESVHTMTVDWNAQTEFLRTYEGDGVFDPVQNYSLGSMNLYLVNKLVAPETVSNSVQLLTFIRFKNPKVAVPRAISPFSFGDDTQYLPTLYHIKMDSFRPCTRSEETDFEALKTDIDMSGAPADGIFKALGTAYFGYKTEESGGQYALTMLENLIILDGSKFYWVTPKSGVPGTGETGQCQIGVSGNDTKFFYVGPLTSAVKKGLAEKQRGARVELFKNLIAHSSVEGEPEKLAEEPFHEPASEVTDGTIDDRENIPCRLEVGSKFEFCVSDVHEIGRRYVRFSPRVDPSDQEFLVFSEVREPSHTTKYGNCAVSIYSNLKNLFAAWAGSVKFRVFQKIGKSNTVMFAPFYNQDSVEPGVPVIDSFGDSTFFYGGKVLNTLGAVAGNFPREKIYPISDEMGFIDVSAPFQSHFNFCLTTKTQSIAPVSSGTMSLALIDMGNDLELYTAFGDDLRLGIFRPPSKVSFKMDNFSDGIAGFH